MMFRTAVLASLVGGAFAVPYLLSDDPDKGNIAAWIGQLQAKKDEPKTSGADFQPPRINTQPKGPGGLLYTSPAPLEGAPFYSLAEVLRMDVTPEWVYARWARKSTGLADPELFGVRVPLVTGTRMHDLAGSLTYYFNGQGQVQHIAFNGRTGDTTQLVNLLVNRFGFRREPSPMPGEQLYQVKFNGIAQSELRTRPESVLWSTSPHTSFEVELALERPGSSRTLKRRIPPIELPGGEEVVMPPQARLQQPEPVPVGPIGLFQKATEQFAGPDDDASTEDSTTKTGESSKDAQAADAEVNKLLYPRRRWPG